MYVDLTDLTKLLLALLTTTYVWSDDGGAFNFSRASDTSANTSSSSSGVGKVVGENYILKPSDVINIEVYQEPDLDKTIRIEGDGSVALALVGKVKIAGMTIAEAQSLITDLYNRDYLVNPQISVLVASFAEKYVNILAPSIALESSPFRQTDPSHSQKRSLELMA